MKLSDSETIKNYLSSNSINGLKGYIIEASNLPNFFDKMKKSQVDLKDNSLLLSKNDLISPDNISEKTKYSFINQEICKFFDMNYLNDLLETFLFVNQQNIYIYYQNQNILVNATNYQNNTFNLDYKGKKKEKGELTISNIEGMIKLKKEFQDLNNNPITFLAITVGLVNDDLYKWKFY